MSGGTEPSTPPAAPPAPDSLQAAPEDSLQGPIEAVATAAPAAEADAAAASAGPGESPAGLPMPPVIIAAPATQTKTPGRVRLLEMARVDSDNAARLVQQQHDFANRAQLLLTAVPAKYFELVERLHDAVRAYNSALLQLPENPIPPVTWYETPNVVLRDAFTGDGLRVRIARVHSHFELVLRFVARNGKPDVPLIEGCGDFGKDLVKRRILMRIEGWVEQGQVTFWYNLDFKRQRVSLDEVPERIVLAVASSDYTQLSREFREQEPEEIEVPADSDLVASAHRSS